jgi:hypothetical protein
MLGYFMTRQDFAKLAEKRRLSAFDTRSMLIREALVYCHISLQLMGIWRRSKNARLRFFASFKTLS